MASVVLDVTDPAAVARCAAEVDANLKGVFYVARVAPRRFLGIVSRARRE